MNKEEFKSELSKLGISITDTQLESLEKYANILIDYNKHTNITAITDKESIYLKHFYDSLTLTKIIDLTKDLSVLDVGSGGGFPGIVIKIVYPNLKLTLSFISIPPKLVYLKEPVQFPLYKLLKK